MSFKKLEKNMTELPWRFFKKIALAQAFVTVSAILITGFVATYYLRTHIIIQSKLQLHESLQTIRKSLLMTNLDPVIWCRSLTFDPRTRYTLIRDDGKVLCDSFMDFEKLENFSHRPEINTVLKTGIGESLRYSRTLSKKMLFATTVISYPQKNSKRKYIIRKAIPVGQIYRAIYKFDQSILIILLPLILIASLAILLKLLQVTLPLRSIFKKIYVLKKTDPKKESDYILGPNSDWKLVENTLDQAKKDLDNYIEELFYENEKFNTLIESISDAILAINKSDKILFINKRFKEFFLERKYSCDSANQPSTINIHNLINSLGLRVLINETLESETSILYENIPLPTRNKSDICYFDISITPLKNTKGEVFGAACIFHDVTSKRLAEQMREDFVANVSHEVKTPLTAVKGYVQVLKETEMATNSETKVSLEKIESNSNRLDILFQNILNLSVIESRQLINKEPVSTEDITNSVISNVTQSYPDKNISIHVNLKLETVYGDPLMIEQVLTNLIDNSFKYSKRSGDIWISWKLDTSSEKNPVCVLLVRDNGIGIAEKHLSRLFERFYRVDPSRSRDIGGTGLGLAIVKHIIQKHGGKIFAHSIPGIETIFKAEIPHKNYTTQ
ncbi:MAG: PAS domain-containing protein [Bacteriovoracaceae bacterium]|nr:PAS domain-containing protein [Bacteriovoracaceae bacterium]